MWENVNGLFRAGIFDNSLGSDESTFPRTRA
jgi:hypothetical protein